MPRRKAGTAACSAQILLAGPWHGRMSMCTAFDKPAQETKHGLISPCAGWSGGSGGGGGGVAKPRCCTVRDFAIPLNVFPQHVLPKLETISTKGSPARATLGNAGNTAPSPGGLSAPSHGWPTQPPPNQSASHHSQSLATHNVPRLPQAAVLQGCFGAAPQPSILPPCDHLGSKALAIQ